MIVYTEKEIKNISELIKKEYGIVIGKFGNSIELNKSCMDVLKDKENCNSLVEEIEEMVFEFTLQKSMENVFGGKSIGLNYRF